MKGNEIVIPYQPLPKQKAFHNSLADFRLYSGAVGAGKTLALCVEGLKLALKYPGSIGLLGRFTYKDLKRTTLFTFLELIKDFPPEFSTYHKTDGTWTFTWPDGKRSLIYFLHLDEIAPIKSLNLDWFGVDEATEITQEAWDLLVTRLRHGVINRPVGFGATNPESKMHFLYQYFIDPGREGYQSIETRTHENTYLPKHYTAQLERYQADEDFYGRYVLGRWGAFKGLVYKGFTREIHVCGRRAPVVGSDLFLGVDFGYNNPFVCLFVERDRDGNLWLLEEYYATEGLLSAHASEIKQRIESLSARARMTHNADLKVSGIYADPSGKQEIMELVNLGLDVQPADNAVNNGILSVKEYLRVDDNGRTRLRIGENCTETIKEFESYKYKVKNGTITDEVLKENDHCMDALRYVCNTLGANTMDFSGVSIQTGIDNASKNPYIVFR